MNEISAEYRETMNGVAKGLDRLFNGDAKGASRRVGFVLLQFSFDGPEGARTNYISNVERGDMLVALKEMVARFEGQHHEGGRA